MSSITFARSSICVLGIFLSFFFSHFFLHISHISGFVHSCLSYMFRLFSSFSMCHHLISIMCHGIHPHHPMDISKRCVIRCTMYSLWFLINKQKLRIHSNNYIYYIPSTFPYPNYTTAVKSFIVEVHIKDHYRPGLSEILTIDYNQQTLNPLTSVNIDYNQFSILIKYDGL